MTEAQELFWKQFHGEILAIDLPQWYKVQDARVYCCNEKCFQFQRDRCLFFRRYLEGCKVFDRMVMRACIEDAKGIWKRCDWEKRSNDVNYMNASFGFCAEQKGCEPCECFENINNHYV